MQASAKKIIFILLFLAATFYFIFFTANDYQNKPDLFLEEKIDTLSNSDVSITDKFYNEFQAGEYCYKNGEFEKANAYFKRVYENYPTVSKGYIKLEAKKYMVKIIQILAEQNKNGTDTEVYVKKYEESSY